jgi:hypothetical protein
MRALAPRKDADIDGHTRRRKVRQQAAAAQYFVIRVGGNAQGAVDVGGCYAPTRLGFWLYLSINHFLSFLY